MLTDIVYYLIFGSYILFTVRFEAAPDWGDGLSPGQLKYETTRVAGILLVIGVLHGLNILLMPVLGRLFSLNRMLRRDDVLDHAQSRRRDHAPRRGDA